MANAAVEVLTIGHSTHPWERFVALLRGVNVTAIGDVRSSPYSRHCPQFDREELREQLRRNGIAYVFLGRELGGRPADRSLYRDGIADYERMASASELGKGLDRVVDGARQHRIALLCSEQDPLDCHRTVLVSRRLAERGAAVEHLLADGGRKAHAAVEEELLERSGDGAPDLFTTAEDRAQRLARAYRERERAMKRA